MPDHDIETVEEFDEAWEEGVPVDTQTMLTQPHPLPPESGWLPKDFPHLTFDHVPYSTNAMPRADPFMTITPEGWLYVEAGNTRLAVPDLEEWNKFVYMVTCLWNAWALQQQANKPDEGEKSDDDSATDPGDDPGPPTDPSDDQLRSRDEAGTSVSPSPESG